VSDFFSHLAIQWATTHPRDFFWLLGKKAILYFNNFEVPDNQDMYFFSRYSWVLRLPLLMFGIVFALGFAGMLSLTRRSLARWALFVFFLVYGGSVIVFYVFSRYRLPAVPALFPFAGAMLIRLGNGVRKRLPLTAHRLPPPGGKFPISNFQFPISNSRSLLSLLAVAACGAITLWPIQHKGKDEAAQCLVNLGAEYYQEGDTAKAVATFNEALQTQPEYGEALRNLGIIQLSRGRTDEAFNLLSQAERSDPGNAVTHQILGKVWEQRRMLSPADIEYRRAVVLAPGRVEYRFSLATVLQNLDSVPAALAQYDTMIALAPDNPLVRHNHAVALFRAGRLTESAAELDTVRRLGGQVNPQFEQALQRALAKGEN
jgi:Tfp pilus assembly protein PilF